MIIPNECDTPVEVNLSPGKNETPNRLPPLEEDCMIEENRLLAPLLRLGDNYWKTGSIHQATEIYFKLFDNYPETRQGKEALERLMKISEKYEEEGMLRQARSIYERVLR